MKKTIFISLLLSCGLSAFGQDTIVVYRNYKYKIGMKLSSDKSGDLLIAPSSYRTYSFGIQLIKKIKKSDNFSLLSGVYYNNRALFNEYFFHTITYPLGIRYENKVFYLSGEIYINYLLKEEDFLNLSNKIKYRPLNAGINLSIGIEKDICKQLDFFVELHDMTNFTPIKINEQKTYLVNYGFSLGLNYKIF